LNLAANSVTFSARRNEHKPTFPVVHSNEQTNASKKPMKARVNRSLQGGIYNVSFAFSDFTQEELTKMKSFGVPTVQVKVGLPPKQATVNIAINQVQQAHVASFISEEEAKNYENVVLSQAKAGMDALRQRKDEFTSTAEVDI
jgi:hypothetical protein